MDADDIPEGEDRARAECEARLAALRDKSPGTDKTVPASKEKAP